MLRLPERLYNPNLHVINCTELQICSTLKLGNNSHIPFQTSAHSSLSPLKKQTSRTAALETKRWKRKSVAGLATGIPCHYTAHWDILCDYRTCSVLWSRTV